jgi:hypothetical protein
VRPAPPSCLEPEAPRRRCATGAAPPTRPGASLPSVIRPTAGSGSAAGARPCAAIAGAAWSAARAPGSSTHRAAGSGRLRGAGEPAEPLRRPRARQDGCRFSPDDYLEVFDEAPEGAPAHDLPPPVGSLAPDHAPEEITETAARLRAAAGLPDSPTGVADPPPARTKRKTPARGRSLTPQPRGSPPPPRALDEEPWRNRCRNRRDAGLRRSPTLWR